MAPRPDALRPHYRRFLSPGRVLLTGHSHQAWPDVAWDGVERAMNDAATHADDKWGPAFEAADAVRAYVAHWVGARAEQVALAANTHELVCRFLSALDLVARPHLVTTTGEFHSITRQLRRLDEQGLVKVTFVPAEPVATLAARLGEAVTARTAAVLTSTVLFETSSVVPQLPALVAHARGLGVEVLLDAYHAFGVLPFSLTSLGAGDAFLVGGGYKYAQWGEGNCFLVVPPREFRPVLTGWFAGFAHLSQRQEGVGYGAAGAEAFAGSTYDPISHYRARAVIDFFQAQGLTAQVLRDISLRQTQRLIDGLAGLELATPSAPEARAGFVAVRTPDASGVSKALASQGILTDARGDRLRLGPAPYLLDAELDRGVEAVRRLLAPRA